jgi:transposase-like protein
LQKLFTGRGRFNRYHPWSDERKFNARHRKRDARWVPVNCDRTRTMLRGGENYADIASQLGIPEELVRHFAECESRWRLSSRTSPDPPRLERVPMRDSVRNTIADLASRLRSPNIIKEIEGLLDDLNSLRRVAEIIHGKPPIPETPIGSGNPDSLVTLRNDRPEADDRADLNAIEKSQDRINQ